MELQGRVKSIIDLSTDRIKKKQLVLLVDGKYPYDVAIDFINDKVSLLDNVRNGLVAKVKINVQSREYNGKYYTNVTGWKVDLEFDIMNDL